MDDGPEEPGPNDPVPVSKAPAGELADEPDSIKAVELDEVGGLLIKWNRAEWLFTSDYENLTYKQ